MYQMAAKMKIPPIAAAIPTPAFAPGDNSLPGAAFEVGVGDFELWLLVGIVVECVPGVTVILDDGLND